MAIGDPPQEGGKKHGTEKIARAFAKLHREIWGAMREEVLKAYEAQKVL